MTEKAMFPKRIHQRETMKNKYKSIIAIIGTLIISACHDSIYYHHFEDVSTEGWTNADTVSFDIPVPEKDTEMDLEVQARYTNKFQYKKLNLLIETECNGHSTGKDTLSLDMFTDNGTKTGNGITYIEENKTFKKINVRKGQKIRLKIIHNMRHPSIKGLSGIGIQASTE